MYTPEELEYDPSVHGAHELDPAIPHLASAMPRRIFQHGSDDSFLHGQAYQQLSLNKSIIAQVPAHGLSFQRELRQKGNRGLYHLSAYEGVKTVK